MASGGLADLTALELAAAIRGRRVSPVEAVEAALHRIEALNPRLNAFCLVLADEARAAARRAEAAVMRGEALGPLHRVPVSVEDLVFTRGVRTTFGSAPSTASLRPTPGLSAALRILSLPDGRDPTSTFTPGAEAREACGRERPAPRVSTRTSRAASANSCAPAAWTR